MFFGQAKLMIPAKEPMFEFRLCPFAFDSIDNDGDTRLDLDDPDEILLPLRIPGKETRALEMVDSLRGEIRNHG